MRIAFAALAAVTLVAAPALAQAPQHVELKNNAGEAIGHAMIVDAPKGVLMHVEVKGLTPGWHGLHFHEKADCSKSDFTSAGGHVHDNPTMVHGLLNADANEAGDLPNLYVAPDGTANAEIFSTFVSLRAPGKPQLADADGSALVIHASPDDHKSQPIGGAGARVACGEIR
jgi:Cu-Zn family superoxide dismutase